MRRPVGVKWFLCRSCLSRVSSQPSYQLSPPFHPHSSMSEFFRSVQVGRSRFSRCCHLIIDLSSIVRWKLGQAIVAVTGTRRLGFVLPIGSTTPLPAAWPVNERGYEAAFCQALSARGYRIVHRSSHG